MKKKELLYESLIDIDPDLVEQADSYEFGKVKPRFAARAVIIAAACAALGLAVFGVVRLGKKLPDEKSALSPTASPTETASSAQETAQPSPTPFLFGKTVIKGEKGHDSYESIIQPGEVRVLGPLYGYMKGAGNPDYLYYVQIEVSYYVPEECREFFIGLSEALENAEDDPVHREFIHCMYQWISEIKMQEMTSEELERYWNGAGSEDVWLPYYDEFFDYYSENVSSEKSDAFRNAHQRYTDALYEWKNYEIPQALQDAFMAELDRMCGQGLILELDSADARHGTVNAYLTQEQIVNFPVDPDYAYRIYFADGGYYVDDE